MNTYHFQEEDQIPSPALIYYKDTIERNIDKSVEEAGGAGHLWPHVKSHKMEAVLKLQIQKGITRFKCATMAEARMAAKAGAECVLVAYPLVGPVQDQYLELIKRWPECRFYMIADDLDQIKTIAGKAVAASLQLNLCVDVNTGMNRTGVQFKQLKDFCENVKEIEGIHLAGYHCYDGNRHEKDLSQRKVQVEKTIREIREIAKKDEILIMGGSPTFPVYAEEMKNGRTFYSPGTIFIYDVGYQEQFPDLPYEPGAAILTRVVSHPADGYFTIDCGYKAVSAEQVYSGILTGVSHCRPAFQSEEHWTFQMESGYEKERPVIGQILFVMPWHICPTTALYGEAIVVEQGIAAGTWAVSARNRMIGVGTGQI